MPTNAIALTRLLLRERPTLVRLAERILGSRPAAEDVAQSLWLKVQRIEDDPPIIHQRAYLFRLASNMAIDVARAERRREEVHAEVMDLLHHGVDGISGERIALARDELERLRAVIATLPDRTRQIFELSRVEGLAQREIAARLGVSRPTVEKHLRNALDAVTRALTREP